MRETLVNFTIKSGTEIPPSPILHPQQPLSNHPPPPPLNRGRTHLHLIYNKYLHTRPKHDSTTNTSHQIYFHIHH